MVFADRAAQRHGPNLPVPRARVRLTALAATAPVLDLGLLIERRRLVLQIRDRVRRQVAPEEQHLVVQVLHHRGELLPGLPERLADRRVPLPGEFHPVGALLAHALARHAREVRLPGLEELVGFLVQPGQFLLRALDLLLGPLEVADQL